MKNTTILAGVIVAMIIVAAVVFTNSKSPTDKVIVDNPDVVPGETQKVVISEKDFNYYPSEIRVKVNQPVEITLDNRVKGCLRAFTIKELGISKYLSTPNDAITFTPAKKGKYKFACSMGMGYGTLIVE
jgi:plastocyanin domain-containing protein